MLTDTIHAATNTLRYATATLRMQRAAAALLDALKQKDHWRWQPRIPEGLPGGGRWTEYDQLNPPIQVHPIWVDIGPGIVPANLGRAAVAKLFAAATRSRQLLIRMPKLWAFSDLFPTQDEFDPETGRIGPPTARRPEIPFMMFSKYSELKKYLGPAGPDRVWHHIVEQRLTGTLFPAGMIHNTDNVVNVPAVINQLVGDKMSRRGPEYGGRVRRFAIGEMSFEDQYNIGIKLLRQTYIEADYDETQIGR